MTDSLAEIREGFFVECDELLEILQDGLCILAPDIKDDEAINTVFRAVHSIKGGAGAFGLTQLVAFAHRYESALDAIRSGRALLTDHTLRLLFHAADLLQDHVRVAREGSSHPDDGTACLNELETAFTGEEARLGLHVEDQFTPLVCADGYEGETAWLVHFLPSSELYDSGNEPLFLLRALAKLGTARVVCNADALPDLDALDPEKSYLGWSVELNADVTEADIREVFDFVDDLCTLSITRRKETMAVDRPASDVAPAPRDETNSTVRVDLERVDRLMNLVGELVINQSMLAQSISQAGIETNSAVMTGLEAFNSLTREIQDSVMMIRAQPVKPLFQRMARVVREVSSTTGKMVRLDFAGEMTEVDRTVIERLSEPLTHMIRNAIDHGIELPARRIALGKSAEGVVRLSARHRAGRLVIEMSDDGAGIDRERVRELAIARGLISPDAVLSDSDVDNILFLPGFSTSKTVSSLSGRGVGMDIVRQGIHVLGGRITIESSSGVGTRFTISLPLTLAVLDGMVVTVAGETLVVPLSSITETAALLPAEVRKIAGGSHVLHVRGAFLPILDIGSELGYRAARNPEEGGIVLLTAQEDSIRSALIVDRIVEQRQVVIKGLRHSFGHIPGIAAATILGDGRVALILDPADLVAHTGRAPALHDLALVG